MTASERRKGHTFEREVASYLRERLGLDSIRRGMQQMRGLPVPDVEAPKLWIECKNSHSISPRAAVNQARGYAARARDDRIPVAVLRMHRDKRPILCCTESDWCRIIAEVCTHTSDLCIHVGKMSPHVGLKMKERGPQCQHNVCIYTSVHKCSYGIVACRFDHVVSWLASLLAVEKSER